MANRKKTFRKKTFRKSSKKNNSKRRVSKLNTRKMGGGNETDYHPGILRAKNSIEQHAENIGIFEDDFNKLEQYHNYCLTDENGKIVKDDVVLKQKVDGDKLIFSSGDNIYYNLTKHPTKRGYEDSNGNHYFVTLTLKDYYEAVERGRLEREKNEKDKADIIAENAATSLEIFDERLKERFTVNKVLLEKLISQNCEELLKLFIRGKSAELYLKSLSDALNKGSYNPVQADTDSYLRSLQMSKYIPIFTWPIFKEEHMINYGTFDKRIGSKPILQNADDNTLNLLLSRYGDVEIDGVKINKEKIEKEWKKLKESEESKQTEYINRHPQPVEEKKSLLGRLPKIPKMF